MFIHLDFSIHGDVVACRRRELFVAPAVSLLNSSHAEFDTSKVNKNCKLFYTLSEASVCIFVKMVGLSVAGWWTLWILAQWLEFDLFLSSPLWDVDGFRQASFSLYHTRTFNDPFSGTAEVSQYQKGKTNLNFSETRDSEWQWHQLGHMQVYGYS